MNKWVKPGSIGKAAPGYDVRIVNNMGKEVPRGEQAGGQIAFQIFFISFKGTLSRGGYFFAGLNILISTFCVRYALNASKVFQKSFTTLCSYYGTVTLYLLL
jgi:hypothetical protein